MATYNTLIIAAADREAANQFWIDKGAGENTFSVGLVPLSGPASATPPTHYIASAQFERYFPGSIFAFKTQFPVAKALEYTGASSGSTTYVNNQLVSQGLQRQVL